jgi:hypothetical protein
MKRSELNREIAYAEAILDPAIELLKTRFPSLVRDAVEREFSSDAPLAMSFGEPPALSLPSRALQVVATGFLCAARERAALYVARAVADRLAAGEGEKWLSATRDREARAQREFEELKRKHQRESRDRDAVRARVARIRNSPTGTRERTISAKRAALSARVAALRLPRIQ